MLFEPTNLQTLCGTPCHAVDKDRLENRVQHVRPAWIAHLAAEVVRTQSIEHLENYREGVPPELLNAVESAVAVASAGT